MSANHYQPHVIVIPEDRANRQILSGFQLVCSTRSIHRVPEAGGWLRVLDCFQSEHIPALRKYPARIVVLLVDFDGDMSRGQQVKSQIPADLQDRVFGLGSQTCPEDLKTAGLGSFETIGRKMAQDCCQNTNEIWDHELLRHNAAELARFCQQARPILFGG